MKKQVANKMSHKMTANMQDYNSPQLLRYIMGEEGWGTQSQTSQQLTAVLTTQ